MVHMRCAQTCGPVLAVWPTGTRQATSSSTTAIQYTVDSTHMALKQIRTAERSTENTQSHRRERMPNGIKALLDTLLEFASRTPCARDSVALRSRCTASAASAWPNRAVSRARRPISANSALRWKLLHGHTTMRPLRRSGRGQLGGERRLAS
jgi:hypothetical protein